MSNTNRRITKRKYLNTGGWDKFARLLNAAMEDNQWTQRNLIDELAMAGFESNPARITRLQKGEAQPIEFLLALSRVKLLKNPHTGEVLTFEQIAEVICGYLDFYPEVTPEEKLTVLGVEIERTVEIGCSPKQLASLSMISPERLQQLKSKVLPTLDEVIRLAPHLIDNDGKPWDNLRLAMHLNLVRIDSRSESSGVIVLNTLRH